MHPTFTRFAPGSLQTLVLALLLVGTVGVRGALAQSESASASGRVTDQTGAVIVGAEVEIKDVDTSISQVTLTNGEGVYAFPFLKPGRYVISVRMTQFRTVSATGIALHAQDSLSRNFTLEVGSSAESITVSASAVHINTQNASVATVVDRQFVENIPLNGRSLQSLITLAPGIVTTSTGGGQFSVNGQRTSSNSFTVDGVSANINAGSGSNIGLSGNLPGLTTSGTTQSLVSVDALQEFKIQTSTYSAEFGTRPGGQVSLVTRSGTNQYHGNLFEYLRNDKFDATDWFANRAGTEKPPERQNDFGGTLGGPLSIPHVYDGRDRTFFFFSYEGLRLRLPRFALTNVPTMELRRTVPASLQPLMNAFPQPNGKDLGNGFAEFTSSYADPSTLDATSIKVNHQLTKKVSMFVRYNNAPSTTSTRSTNDLAANTTSRLEAETLTMGATALLTPRFSNDLRVNFSRNDGLISTVVEPFGGAIAPARSALIPPEFDPGTGASGSFTITLAGRTAPATPFLSMQDDFTSAQRQLNIVNNASLTFAAHQLKFGVDYRRLTPVNAATLYNLNAQFLTQAQLIAGTSSGASVSAGLEMHPLFSNLSVYAQDTWKVTGRLTLNLGVRWELNPTPTEANGHDPVVVDQVDDLRTMKLAPAGTPQWKTTYNNFAPRVGVAYALRQSAGHETVLRGGFGLYYDTGNDVGAQNIGLTFPWRSSRNIVGGITFPYQSAQVAPIPVPVSLDIKPYNSFYGFDPNLKLPYTWQWNFAAEQALGSHQSLTLTYVGAAGRRLLQLANTSLSAVNPTFLSVSISRNAATSDYHALQAQFQRRLSHGLQALVGYTWSHALDEDSSNFSGFTARRGNAAFDIRHVLTSAVTYDIPAPGSPAWTHMLFGHWSIDTAFHGQTAPPIDVTGTVIISPIDGQFTSSRPNFNPDVPLYIEDPLAPGGLRINRDAFVAVPAGTSGNLGRNVIRTLGAWQLDLALRREFPMAGGVRVQFRAEGFNIFNHPNFGGFQRGLNAANFGQATSMLNQAVGGGLSPLYQIGGPRSFQFALKLVF